MFDLLAERHELLVGRRGVGNRALYIIKECRKKHSQNVRSHHLKLVLKFAVSVLVHLFHIVWELCLWNTTSNIHCRTQVVWGTTISLKPLHIRFSAAVVCDDTNMIIVPNFSESE